MLRISLSVFHDHPTAINTAPSVRTGRRRRGHERQKMVKVNAKLCLLRICTQVALGTEQLGHAPSHRVLAPCSRGLLQGTVSGWKTWVLTIARNKLPPIRWYGTLDRGRIYIISSSIPRWIQEKSWVLRSGGQDSDCPRDRCGGRLCAFRILVQRYVHREIRF